MDLNFSDAKPVKRAIPGRTGAPNPFVDVVKTIALAKDEKGEPVAKSFTVPYGTWEDGKATNDKATEFSKLMRQLHDAGTKLDTPVSVYKDVKVNGRNQATVTFWTGPKVTKPRKSKPTPEPTPETTPETSQAA